MDKLIIAVCVLGIVVTIIFWVLDAWDRPGKDTEGQSHRNLMKEIRRNVDDESQEEGR